MSVPETAKGIRFSPEIQLGHVLQAIVMLVAVGGWAIAGYMSIDKQLATQAAEMALIKQRLSLQERATVETNEQVRAMAAETRAVAGKISDQIADLRTLVAGQGRK